MKKYSLIISLEVVILILLASLYFYVTQFLIQDVTVDMSILENLDIADSQSAKIELDENIQITANIPIFMYHWVRDDTGDYPYPENMVKPSELRKQMEYLKENDYDVIFASEIDSLQHYDKPVMLTFDDGWMDVYNEAFPLAKEYNMKISMYVITDLIGAPSYCTLEQLIEMRDSGLVEIDSHTISHPRLAELTLEQMTKELVESKAYLKENLNLDSRVICYPCGSYNKLVGNIASQNYEYGLLMDGGVYQYNSNNSNPYEITRIYAMRSMTINTFANYCVASRVNIK